MSAWRAAGISYVRFSFVASNAMKKGLNADALGKLTFSPEKNFVVSQEKISSTGLYLKWPTLNWPKVGHFR